MTYSRVLSTALLVGTALVGGSLATTSTAAADVIVVVEAGDSLSEIAAEYGVSGADLMVANGFITTDDSGDL